METNLNENDLQKIYDDLKVANQKTQKFYPGESENRQAVHTVYGGAHLFKSSTASKIGEIALKSFKTYAHDAQTLASALGLRNPEITEKVFERVHKKLENEAVEDFRIDFEDGFGPRPDEEEDRYAVNAALEVAKGMAEKTLSPFIGIRIKTFSEELKRRGVRTLDIFISTLLKETKGQLPENFVVTLPKITSAAQVSALVVLFEKLEEKTGLPPGSLKMEFMIETPQSIFNADGGIALPSFVQAAQGRVTGAHFGTYDYTASINITADYQTMDHPSCDFARHAMKVALSGTGIFLSDGATNVMPVEIHRKPTNDKERKENFENIHRVWKLNFSHIQHSLKHGYYQGWDLHPAQIPVRYAALYYFFLSGLHGATERLRHFIEQASKATLVGDIFDDAATGQGLLNYFLKAANCGAITEEEFLATGLTLEEIRTRSFHKILEGRNERRSSNA